MGIPKSIVEAILGNIECRMFVETGTFHADTAIWAADFFSEVHTIEFSKECHEIAFLKIKKSQKNIHLHYGDSREILVNIYQNKMSPALLWLDAHWCSGISYGQNDQCALSDELDIINKANQDDIILIDDARLFLAPPPLPNEIQYWPNLKETTTKLLEIDRYIAVFEDVIFAFPIKYRVCFENILQHFTTKSWLSNSKVNRSLRDRIASSKSGLKQIIKSWI